MNVHTHSTMAPAERGGRAVVLLHGWGAPADDLVPLAEALARPGTRFFVPAGLLPGPGGGRAWWDLDPGTRPEHADEDGENVPPAVHPQVAAARAAVQALLQKIAAQHAPDEIVLAGFSQGGMLAIDVALAEGTAPPVAAVAVLSGLFLADSLPGLRAPRGHKPAVFVSHGRQDSVLPFRAGERAKALFERHGFPVTWAPFDGGHDIPPETLQRAAAFLFGRR